MITEAEIAEEEKWIRINKEFNEAEDLELRKLRKSVYIPFSWFRFTRDLLTFGIVWASVFLIMYNFFRVSDLPHILAVLVVSNVLTEVLRMLSLLPSRFPLWVRAGIAAQYELKEDLAELDRREAENRADHRENERRRERLEALKAGEADPYPELASHLAKL